LGVKTLFSEIKDLETEVLGIATKSQDFLNSEKDEISISEFLKKGLFLNPQPLPCRGSDLKRKAHKNTRQSSVDLPAQYKEMQKRISIF